LTCGYQRSLKRLQKIRKFFQPPNKGSVNVSDTRVHLGHSKIFGGHEVSSRTGIDMRRLAVGLVYLGTMWKALI
jgi:hypothetical protein